MVWLTATNGRNKRDPVLARLGANLPERYLVGWMMDDDRTILIGLINAAETFLEGPEEMSETGPGWGSRDDSFKTAPGASVVWLEGDAHTTSLRLYGYADPTVISDGFESSTTSGWSSSTN